MADDRPVTLDRPERYRILVQARMSNDSPLLQSIRFVQERSDGETSTLVGFVDQAELHGALRSLYYVGIPIISVTCDRDEGGV